MSDTRFGDLLDRIHVGDCLKEMQRIPEHSVDLVLCDLPYGTTQCPWDSVIPFVPLWAEYRRIARPNAAIVLTAAQPFASLLVCSNLKDFRYEWIWEKSKASGYLNAKRRPLVAHEHALVFSREPHAYFPQMTNGSPYNKGRAYRPTAVYGAQRATEVRSDEGLRYPRSVLYCKTAESEGRVIHPTQKPVGLFEQFVKTYSRPGEVVLDNCIGSGTTAIACMRTGRRFIGFERDQTIAEGARARIALERAECRDNLWGGV